MSGIGMEPDLGSTSPNSDRFKAILTQNKVSYPQLSPPLELHAKPFYAQPNVIGGGQSLAVVMNSTTASIMGRNFFYVLCKRGLSFCVVDTPRRCSLTLAVEPPLASQSGWWGGEGAWWQWLCRHRANWLKVSVID